MSYEFTGETKTTTNGTVLQRIRATRGLPRHGVRAGDVGGWIESEKNLYGNAWVFGDAQVFGDARVFGDAWVFGDARVSGDARVFGDARVSGDAQVFGDARVSGDAQVSGNAQVYGNAQVSGDAQVSKAQHVLTISPIGSESVTATGTVDDLADEVKRRSSDWECDGPTHLRWLAEYAALETLVRARITGWKDAA